MLAATREPMHTLIHPTLTSSYTHTNPHTGAASRAYHRGQSKAKERMVCGKNRWKNYSNQAKAMLKRAENLKDEHLRLNSQSPFFSRYGEKRSGSKTLLYFLGDRTVEPNWTRSRSSTVEVYMTYDENET